MIIVLMGVSGAGKTTIGQQLAAALQWPFYEGDDFHPAANIAKMGQGIPLSDADRSPWLLALRQLIHQLEAEGQSAVLSCSALKQSYRDRLRGDTPMVQFVYLQVSPDLLRQRLEQRQNHFMQANLLLSQLATLETPDQALMIPADQPPMAIVAEIRQRLGL